MGRPTKCTPELTAKVVEAIRAGNFREVAAQWVGVSPANLSRWMTRPGEPYETFRQAVLEAEQLAEIDAVALIMKAAKGDAKHAQWWLERKFPSRWGRKDRHELTGADGGRIEHGVSVEVDAEALCDRIEALARELAGEDEAGEADEDPREADAG